MIACTEFSLIPAAAGVSAFDAVFVGIAASAMHPWMEAERVA